MKYLIVGLGNPGKDYENTRHNIGRDIVMDFALQNHFSDWSYSKYADAQYSRGFIESEEVELLLPETFMNNSGKSVAYAQDKHNLNTENIIIVHDDLDMSLGQIKLQFNRGTGGHNGLKSIVEHIKTREFTRLKFGILSVGADGKQRKPKGERDVLNFVLKKFMSSERELLIDTKKRAVDAISVFINKGMEAAMNEFH